MSFEQLIAKVEQAEHALEAQERRVAADVRQLKSSWREAWTPGRIVVAGAITGFLVGRARPLRLVDGGNALQMVSALAGLFAGGSAQVAAGEAAQAAEHAEDAAAQEGAGSWQGEQVA
jgi:lipid-binding SYLF domain-containing protein